MKKKNLASKNLELGHLDSDRILDVAYCAYVVEEPQSSKKATVKMARSVMRDFEKIAESVEDGTPEWCFIFEVKTIIVPLARGISRGKKLYAEKIRLAEEEKEERVKMLNDSTRKSGLARGSAKALLLGGLGFVLVKAFFPSLNLPQETNPTYTSLAVGIAVALLSTYLQAWVMNFKFVQIFACHELAKTHAHRRYRSEVRIEYQRAKFNAIEAWERFTGEKVPKNIPGFEEVIDMELQLEREFQDGRYELTANPFVKLFKELSPMGIIRSMFSGWGRKEEETCHKE